MRIVFVAGRTVYGQFATTTNLLLLKVTIRVYSLIQKSEKDPLTIILPPATILIEKFERGRRSEHQSLPSRDSLRTPCRFQQNFAHTLSFASSKLKNETTFKI